MSAASSDPPLDVFDFQELTHPPLAEFTAHA